MSYIGYDVGFQKAFTMDEYTGAAGVSVYPLSSPKPLNERSILVVVDGIVQKPFYSYTLDANSDLKFDGTTIGGEMITITHLGRPVTMGVPSDGSIVSSHFSNVDFTFPANIQTGQGDQLTFQYDSTTPTATQGIIWDRGGGTDVYLRYNPTTNVLESNVTIGTGGGGGASSIDDLTDVDITTTAPTAGQVLVWNATNNEFEPGAAATSTDDLTEGTTNLFYTDARADVRATLRITAASIGNLADVDITTTAPTAGQVLVWNATNNEFEPGAPAATSIGGLSDVDITTTAPTAGQVLKWNATNNEFEPADDVDTNLTTIDQLGDVDITTTAPADGEVLKWVAASNKFVPGVAAAALSYSSSTFTGNGTLANYAIPTGHTVDDVLVFLNGVAQVPTTDYTIAATVLTFGTAPLTGQSIVFRFLPV